MAKKTGAEWSRHYFGLDLSILKSKCAKLDLWQTLKALDDAEKSFVADTKRILKEPRP